MPRSDNRPHMSVTERRYFRRGSDGTRVLDHGEIRELMFANREARLEINLRLRRVIFAFNSTSYFVCGTQEECRQLLRF